MEKGAMAYMDNGEWVNTVISDGRISTNFDFTFNGTEYALCQYC